MTLSCTFVGEAYMAGGLVAVLLIGLLFWCGGRNCGTALAPTAIVSSRNCFTSQAFFVPLSPCAACFRWCRSCCPHLHSGFSASCGCLARPYGVRLRAFNPDKL